MPTDDLEAFQRWIHLKATEVSDGANQAIAAAAADLATRLVRYTPVDTGRARAGWQVSISTPPSGSEPITLPMRVRGQRGLVRVPFPARAGGRAAGRVVGVAHAPVGAASAAEASDVIRQLKADIAKYRGRGIQGGIYVFNNVPYIVFLNQGHSHQAAAHFIERAILETQGTLSKVTILEK